MPLMWLRAHVEMLSVVQAEEAFRDVEIMAVGSGRLPARERDKVTRRWQSALGRNVENKGSIRLTGTTRDLELMKGTGIGVRTFGPR